MGPGLRAEDLTFPVQGPLCLIYLGRCLELWLPNRHLFASLLAQYEADSSILLAEVASCSSSSSFVLSAHSSCSSQHWASVDSESGQTDLMVRSWMSRIGARPLLVGGACCGSSGCRASGGISCEITSHHCTGITWRGNASDPELRG